jgi:hypothetical protein
VVEVKASKSYAGYDSDSEPERGRQIINMEPNATIATTKLQTGEPVELEEVEHLLYT